MLRQYIPSIKYYLLQRVVEAFTVNCGGDQKDFYALFEKIVSYTNRVNHIETVEDLDEFLYDINLICDIRYADIATFIQNVKP